MSRMQRRGRGQSPQLEITLSESDGIRYLHFGTPWVQGAMRVRRPDELALDYARHMMAWLLFRNGPVRVAQLGLGAGSLTRWVHKHLPESTITVVELSPAVVAVAQSHFKLPREDERFELVIEDAQAFATHPRRRAMFDVVQIDIFDAQVRGPALDSIEFYRGCRNMLDAGGVAIVNLFGEVPSYERNYRNLREAFDGRLLVLPPVEAGNVIVLGLAPGAGPWRWSELYARADEIETRHGLKARGWVEGLRASADGGAGDQGLILAG
ncbi:MAG: fused MFS/spermidine synthase [Burkholderiaceae bacterium]